MQRRRMRYHLGMRRRPSILLRLGAAACLALGATAALAPNVLAHVPLLEPDRSSDAPAEVGNPFPGAIPVPDAAVSRAVYGTLAGDAAFDAWLLEVSAPVATPVEMLVPKRAEYADFRPSFSLVGVGLRTTGTTPGFIAERIDAAAGDGRRFHDYDPGVVNVPDPGIAPRPTFYEPFSFTTYFEGGETTVDLRPGIRYYLVVYEPAGGRGEYALGIGRAERFTLRDAASSVVAVARIKLGLYGQGAFHPLAAGVLLAAAAAVVVAIVLLVRRRRARRRLA